MGNILQESKSEIWNYYSNLEKIKPYNLKSRRIWYDRVNHILEYFLDLCREILPEVYVYYEKELPFILNVVPWWPFFLVAFCKHKLVEVYERS